MNTTMLVTPANGQGSDFGFGGGNGWWYFLLFFLLIGGGAWGNGFGNGNAMPLMAGAYNNTVDTVQKGFDQSEIMGGINGVKDGINGLSSQICGAVGDMRNDINTGFYGVQGALAGGFAGVNANIASGFAGTNASIASGFAGTNANISNGFAQKEMADNARQIDNMQQMFALQTAMGQGFNGTQGEIARGVGMLGNQITAASGENRLGVADLKYTVASESCAGRNQSMQNARDIIDSQTRGTQMILDKLCALELDGYKGQLAQAHRDNIALQNQLNMANFRESQANQNAIISQGFSSEVDALYNRLNSCPIATTPVYGKTPIFNCGPNAGCPGCAGAQF